MEEHILEQINYDEEPVFELPSTEPDKSTNIPPPEEKSIFEEDDLVYSSILLQTPKKICIKNKTFTENLEGGTQKTTLFESLFSSIVLFFTYPFSFSIKSLIILTILILILFVVFVTYEFYQTKLETTIHIDKIIRNHSFLPKYILDKNGKCYYVGDYLFSLLKEDDYERWKEDYQYKVLCIGHSFDLRIIQVFEEIEPTQEEERIDEDSSLNTIKNLFGAI